MARQSQIKFTIPEPCNVPWKGMIPVDTDQRYCSSCDKVVTDFSKMSDDELMLYFRHNNGKICGRLHKTQLNRPMNLLPEKTVNAKWWRTLILIPLTLFGKQAKAQFVYATKQMQSPDTAAIAQQNNSLKNDSVSKEKVAIADSAKPSADSLKLSIVKFDSTYQYVWKPIESWTFYDSLHANIVDVPLVTGGCVAIEPLIVTIPEPIYTYPWIQPSQPIIDWITQPDPFYIEEDPVSKSILTILLDTIVPLRKKKHVNHVLAGNSEIVETKNPLKEVSDKPHEKPKPPQPALPAS
ncbi:MAG TPA: hypothetical protein VFJ43_08585, partial [Bacteroidia bacterium]|nr:hypothetical protein [Bacteroidia bacterium]